MKASSASLVAGVSATTKLSGRRESVSVPEAADAGTSWNHRIKEWLSRSMEEVSRGDDTEVWVEEKHKNREVDMHSLAIE